MAEEPDEDVDVAPPTAVTPALFAAWRAPRFGCANPERMDNPVWQWLIATQISAWRAKNMIADRAAEDDAPDGDGPGWSFDRFGRSETALADGRVIMIGGEHEDFYDPDFCIYNDVVVRHLDGTLAIYGYPKTVFPPTDSHSATLAGNRIVIIGALGYQDERRLGTTPVYVLDLDSFAIHAVVCAGDAPGWLHKHKAVLMPDGNAILVTEGAIDGGDPDRPFPENIDDWKLDLRDWRWERLTKRRWQRWDVTRIDKSMNELFELRALDFHRRHAAFRKEAEEGMEWLKEKLGAAPDLALLAVLYDPPVRHETMPEREDEYGIYRIEVNGVTVRYNETSWYIRMTIEGDLPSATVEALTADLIAKISKLENRPYELIRL